MVKKDVYIWGTGYGFEIVALCLKENVIAGYIDSNKKKQGKNIYGLKIYSPEEIDLKNSKIIISIIKFEGLKSELLERGCILENIYAFWDENEKGNFGNLISDEERWNQIELELYKKKDENYKDFENNKYTDADIIRVAKIVNNIRPMFCDRKIVLVGLARNLEKFSNELKQNIQSKIWGWVSLSEKEKLKSEKYRDINELFMESMEELDFFIIDSKTTRKYIGILLEMGFEEYQIRVVGENFLSGTKKLDVYDVHVGYTRIDDLPGFSVFGDNKDNSAYKIVTLGGSTSDPTLCNIKSWSEFLYEQLSNMGMNVCIYAGGISSYTVAQELFKLIRDVITLKPDMVLSYSGINDATLVHNNKEFPFVLNYHRNIFQEAVEKNLISNIFMSNLPINKLSIGLETDGNVSKHWIKCQKMMYAICKQFGIAFYGFLQPYNVDYNLAMETKRAVELFYKQTIEELKEESNIGWLYDYTNIFEEQENIFFDICHVYEKGNRIIVRKIIKIVLEEMRK